MTPRALLLSALPLTLISHLLMARAETSVGFLLAMLLFLGCGGLLAGSLYLTRNGREDKTLNLRLLISAALTGWGLVTGFLLLFLLLGFFPLRFF